MKTKSENGGSKVDMHEENRCCRNREEMKRDKEIRRRLNAQNKKWQQEERMKREQMKMNSTV
jgi:hypothetical protein